MKKTYLTLLAASAFFMTSCGGGEEAETDGEKTDSTEASTEEVVEEVTTADFNLDTENSMLEWTGYKAEKTDYQHIGRADITNGDVSLEMKGDDLKVTAANFTVDLTTLREPGAEDPKMEEKLINHLSSEDFFNVSVSEFAQATFTAESHDVENNVVTGKVSIMGQEIPAKIENPEMMIEGDNLNIKANFALDFTPLSMPGMQAKEGEEEEKISETVKFTTELTLNKI